MTEHLPECILPTYLDAVLWRRAPQGLRVPCICNELRACEDRVRTSDFYSAISGEYFKRGHAAGLNAAREAVASISGQGIFVPRIYKHEALTAIDALKKARDD